jgi:hypothetical protein
MPKLLTFCIVSSVSLARVRYGAFFIVVCGLLVLGWLSAQRIDVEHSSYPTEPSDTDESFEQGTFAKPLIKYSEVNRSLPKVMGNLSIDSANERDLRDCPQAWRGNYTICNQMRVEEYLSSFE